MSTPATMLKEIRKQKEDIEGNWCGMLVRFILLPQAVEDHANQRLDDALNLSVQFWLCYSCRTMNTTASCEACGKPQS